MRKYSPSVKFNNELKDKIEGELKALVYRLEKRKRNERLGEGAVDAAIARMKEQIDALAESVGTGDENVGAIAKDAEQRIAEVKKAADGDATHRLEGAVDDLCYTITLWTDVLAGATELTTEEAVKAARVGRNRRKLNERLAELAEVKESFAENDRRLEREISAVERDLAEYEQAMLREDNERRINDLYRQIKAAKSKIDMLNTRHGNYSACYNLIDMIYANAQEMLEATDYAAEELGKVRVLLDIDKLKHVIVEPDKAMAILRRMDADIKALATRTATLDEKVFGLDSGTASVSSDALAYKEELMRKQREKQEFDAAMRAATIDNNNSIAEGNKNGII